MKKLVLLLVSVFTLQFATAGNDKPITFEKLPVAARQFVKKYFPDAKVTFVTMDSELFDTSYDLMLADGSRLEFNKKGEWTDVRCRNAQIPAGIVPQPICDFVKGQYPDAQFRSIEKDRYSYEVKLSNRMEIKFDTKFNPVDMDMDD